MRATFLLAVMLSFAVPWTLSASAMPQTSDTQGTDPKSPDMQQQKHPENMPPSSANAPGATGSTSTDTSSTTGTDTTQKRGRRHHHKTRQAKGTLAPDATDTTATH